MRAAVFVDAGYLFAQGSALLAGARQRREDVALNIPRVSATLKETVRSICGVPLLRIYWYDAMRIGRPTQDQIALAETADIKIRLGQINAAGQQKGVDALIVTDLIELARNHAISDAILLAGDEDLRVGVLLSQQFGVRVHLLGIMPATGNQSQTLRQEADTCAMWDKSEVSNFLTIVPTTTSESQVDAAAITGLTVAVDAIVDKISAERIEELKRDFASAKPVPKDLDAALLRVGREHYAQDKLQQSERSLLRDTFIRLVKAR